MSARSVRRLFSPSFLLVFGIVTICGAAMNTIIGAMALRFQKLPAPLPYSLNDPHHGFPTEIGRWIAVSQDTSIDPGVEHALATKEYTFRDYVDRQYVKDEQIEFLKKASVEERTATLTQLRKKKAASVMRVAITYYTGLVDTVAHVPERCFVADGFEIEDSKFRQFTAGEYADGKPRDIGYRFLSFDDQAGIGLEEKRVARNVGYLFNCNGKYTADSIEVRKSLQNLFEPYGYYSKIELMTAADIGNGEHAKNDAGSRDDSMAAMENFLTSALPEFERCLPDWKALHTKTTGK